MADSSAAPLLSESVAALSPTERQHWKLTGELPSSSDDTSRTTPADSSPAEPAAQADQIGSSHSADSEPAPSKKTRGNADTRKAELQADIESLLRRRAELQRDVDSRPAPPAASSRSDAPPAASSPASDGKPPADLLRSPDLSKPPMEEDEWFKQYPSSTLGQFNRYSARYEALQMQAEQARESSTKTARERYQASYSDALKADPDLAEKLPAALKTASPQIELLGDKAGPLDFVALEIQESEHAAALWQYLGDHPEDVTRLSQLRTPAAVVREMARLESRVSTSTSPQAPPAPKRGISLAPTPTTPVGRRTAAPADASLAAVADGDQRRFNDVENAKEIARRKTG